MTPAADFVEATCIAQLERVRMLFQDYQSALPAACRFTNTEWQNLPELYAPPAGTLLLATILGEPAGCVGLRSFPLQGWCEVKRLYVKPECRGLGWGASWSQPSSATPRSLATSGCGSIRFQSRWPPRLSSIE